MSAVQKFERNSSNFWLINVFVLKIDHKVTRCPRGTVLIRPKRSCYGSLCRYSFGHTSHPEKLIITWLRASRCPSFGHRFSYTTLPWAYVRRAACLVPCLIHVMWAQSVVLSLTHHLLAYRRRCNAFLWLHFWARKFIHIFTRNAWWVFMMLRDKYSCIMTFICLLSAPKLEDKLKYSKTRWAVE